MYSFLISSTVVECLMGRLKSLKYLSNLARDLFLSLVPKVSFFRIILQFSQSQGKMLLWNAHLLEYSRKRHFWFFSKVFIEQYMLLHIFVVKVTNCLEIELFTRRNFASLPIRPMSLRSKRTEHAKRRQQQRLIHSSRGGRKQKKMEIR